jgi:uncharacterized RDD family membrane protein YckC
VEVTSSAASQRPSVEPGKSEHVYHAHETPRMLALEGVPLASFGRRAGALALDVIALSVAFLAVAYPVATLWDRFHPGHATQLTFAPLGSDESRNWYSILVFGAYISLSLYLSNGWTIGKRLLGIRVVSTAHEKMTLWQSIERAFGYGVSAAQFGIGFLQYFFSRNCRTTHDRMAETIVIDARHEGRTTPSP